MQKASSKSIRQPRPNSNIVPKINKLGGDRLMESERREEGSHERKGGRSKEERRRRSRKKEKGRGSSTEIVMSLQIPLSCTHLEQFVCFLIILLAASPAIVHLTYTYGKVLAFILVFFFFLFFFVFLFAYT